MAVQRRSKMPWAIFYFVLVASASTYFAYLATRSHYYQAELETLAKGRTPAAIRKDLDLSQLDGAALITASQKRVLSAARVILQDTNVGVELGHFVTRDSAGEKRLACDVYNKVILVFDGEGIAEFGTQADESGMGDEHWQQPRMEIEGPCRTSDDITRIEPIWIPIEKITSTRAGDVELSFGEGVNFKFSHMPTDWPPRWVLTSVRLVNETEPGRDIKISPAEVREIREQPLVLNFK